VLFGTATAEAQELPPAPTKNSFPLKPTNILKIVKINKTISIIFPDS